MTEIPNKNMANAIRFLSADAVQKANSGHPGMPMGMAEAATTLFARFMKFDPKATEWADRDRFVLSAGHGSMLLYSLLHLLGTEDMTMDQIKNFRQLGSITAGHPEYGHAKGIEATAGPLGQGITMAVGMAMAERMMNARFGDDIVDHYTYVIAGDGCLMEGISQEAISFAGNLQLGKLIVLWDDNEICIDGKTSMTTRDDQLARFKASGWDVTSVDGHDMNAVAAAIEAARKSSQPSLIGCKTTIGKGAPNKEGTSATHGAPLGDDELAAAREVCGWPHAPFEVPKDVYGDWAGIGERGAMARAEWQKRLDALPADQKAEFERMMRGELPANFEAALNAYKRKLSDEKPGWATRKASQEALNVFTATVPEMIGGSADLTGSNLTKTPSTEDITPEDFSGRYVRYGVREHGMAAMLNGIALHGGFMPYGGTFLVFADYLRGALRLSALMGQRVAYVLTHDSIGVGEDGPTHQPVETVASLRAMPNLNVFRPADAVESAECWALAIQNKTTPSAMAFTRQGCPTVRTVHTDENLCAKGGYVLADADGDRKATILATGSEVSLALEAREALQADGIPTAVVSMPCWELFDAQPKAYQDEVLKPGTAAVAVEAGLSMGWERYIGRDGGFVGMTGFGASAPGDQLFEHFGITAANVVKAVKDRI